MIAKAPPRNPTFRLALWVIFTGALYVLAWRGWVDGVQGARNVVHAWIWFWAVISLVTLTDTWKKEAVKNYAWWPRWFDALDILLDFGLVAFLVWHGVFPTAAAAALLSILMASARQRARDAMGD